MRAAYVLLIVAAGGALAMSMSRQLPRVGLGSAEGPPREAMATAVDAALRCGVRLFDTAQNYGSEAAVGEGLRRSGEDHFVLCKVDLCSRSREDPRSRARRQVASSLANLGRLDVVALHWPLLLDRSVDDDDARSVRFDAWRELEALVDEGAVGALGVSDRAGHERAQNGLTLSRGSLCISLEACSCP